MRSRMAWTLRTKLFSALVVSFALLALVGALIAESSFREVETRTVRAEASSDVEGVARAADLRLHLLGQNVEGASVALLRQEPDAVLDTLLQSGFDAGLLLRDGEVVAAGGAAAHDPAFRQTLGAMAAGADPDRLSFDLHGGWLVLVSHAQDRRHAAVGALDRETLDGTLLGDLLAHPAGFTSLVLADGRPVASSPGHPGDRAEAFPLTEDAVELEGVSYLAEVERLTSLEAYAVRLVPVPLVEARVDALVARFTLTSAIAYVLAGSVAMVLVALTLSPLGRITDAARRLGRGEELALEVRSRDEMGILAEALHHSARELAQARHRQAAQTAALRAAAEDFQLAVGELARRVGEAATEAEVAGRLAEAIHRATACRGVVVLRDAEVLEVRACDPAEIQAVHALLESGPDAFRWQSVGCDEARLDLAILPHPGREPDARKVEILAAQAELALLRAHGTARLRQAHAALDRTVRQKQVFLDILSHDLKNPIAVARGRAELLARRHPALLPKLRTIEESLDRATRLIEEAVLYSRLEGRDEHPREPMDLLAIAHAAAESLAPLAAPRGITLHVEGPPEGLPCPASRLLPRAVENLLGNAVKWSPQNGEVRVLVVREPDGCALHIVDHGPGIPPEDRPRLFGRFERADHSGVHGTGLGLAIAKRVVDLHRGRIDIEDTPGGGCTMILRIPFASHSRAPPSLLLPSVPPEVRRPWT